jgi:hypothetical protein
MRFFRFLLALTVAASVSCGGGGPTEPKPVDLTGVWTGDLRGSTLTLSVTQHGTTLLATGKLGPDEPLTATGTFTDPVVSLAINRAPYTGITLVGEQHDGTIISAVANGYLLNNVPLVLRRQ